MHFLSSKYFAVIPEIYFISSLTVLMNRTEKNRIADAITDVFFHDVLQLSLRKAMTILIKSELVCVDSSITDLIIYRFLRF
jgi:hypothetical protein